MVFNIVTEKTLESQDAPSKQTPSTASLKAPFYLLLFCSFLFFNSSYFLFKILSYHINLINISVYSHCLKLQGLDLVYVLV